MFCRSISDSIRLIAILPLFVLAAIVSAPASRAEFDAERDVRINAAAAPASIPVGGRGLLRVTFSLPPGVHITDRENGFFFVTPDSSVGLEWGIPSYPAGVTYEGETVYRGDAAIEIPFIVPTTMSKGDSIGISGTTGFQACTETEPVFCSPPVEAPFRTSFMVGRSAVGEEESVDRGEPASIEARAKQALESGSLMALLWIFIGGVLLSFTPCVYPVIPITIAYIGGRSGGSRFRGFTLSLVFVAGLALVYSTLGVVAAATGGVFGLSTQNPWVIGFVTLVFLVMGCGMLGAFNLQLPSSFQTAISSKKRSGYLGALFVGGTTGLIAAPCVGPVLVALLSWVASTGKIVAGFLYLFVFALGLGSLFVLIGTFAGALAALPRAGVWMDYIKHFFGVLMIAVAYYLAKPLIPEEWFLLAVGFGLMALAALFGVFQHLEKEAGFLERIAKAAAIFLIVAGAFYMLLGLAKLNHLNLGGYNTGVLSAAAVKPEGSESAGVKWIHDDEAAALADSKATGKPVMIDFWAEWCAACKELDHQTFSDPVVAGFISTHFIPLKINGTKANDQIKKIWAKYRVKGLPTVLFIAPNGEEIERFEAYRNIEQTMPVLQRAAG